MPDVLQIYTTHLAQELTLREIVNALHSARVEEVVVRNPEHLRHLVVVVEHHLKKCQNEGHGSYKRSPT